MSYAAWVDQNFRVEARMGNEFSILCPFHKDSHASCCVNVVKGLFICYSCGAKGSIHDISRKINVPLTRVFNPEELTQRISKARAPMAPVKTLPERHLLKYRHKTPYWHGRGLSDETIDLFDLGYDPPTRSVTIPIRTVRGNLLGVVKRRTYKVPDGEPRYIYPKGFKISQHLFGGHLLAECDPDEPLVITEGSIDCMTVWEAGYPAVALLGAQLHPHQRSMLTAKAPTDNIVLFLDNDKAGQHATSQVAPQLMAAGFNVKVAVYPDKRKDPADLTNAERLAAIDGAIAFTALRIKRLAG